MGVDPKSILGFYILTFGIMMLALRGKVRVFPPLIKNDTLESIIIGENPWILKIISCIPSGKRDSFMGEAVTKF